jgi:hypothetical protein
MQEDCERFVARGVSSFVSGLVTVKSRTCRPAGMETVRYSSPVSDVERSSECFRLYRVGRMDYSCAVCPSGHIFPATRD